MDVIVVGAVVVKVLVEVLAVESGNGGDGSSSGCDAVDVRVGTPASFPDLISKG
jgi:hypothetical protein